MKRLRTELIGDTVFTIAINNVYKDAFIEYAHMCNFDYCSLFTI